MINVKHIFYLVCLYSLTECNSLYYYDKTPRNACDIEVLRPADTIIDQSIKRVLVFTRPNLATTINFGKQTNYSYKKLKFNKFYNIEFHSMADLLSTSPRFEIMEPISPVKPPDSLTYNWNELDSICLNYNVDACLVLDSQVVAIDFRFDSNWNELDYSAYGQISVNTLYKLYVPKTKTILTKQVASGLVTGSPFTTDEEVYKAVLKPESLLADYAIENGEQMAQWIAPVWQLDSRPYYTKGNEELKSAKNLIALEKWAEVFKIWRKYSHDANYKVARNASYNEILSYEIEGKLDSALSLAGESYQRFHSREFADYKDLLETRIKEEKLLNYELGIPNDK
jgi:hypothetical protein